MYVSSARIRAIRSQCLLCREREEVEEEVSVIFYEERFSSSLDFRISTNEKVNIE